MNLIFEHKDFINRPVTAQRPGSVNEASNSFYSCLNLLTIFMCELRQLKKFSKRKSKYNPPQKYRLYFVQYFSAIW